MRSGSAGVPESLEWKRFPVGDGEIWLPSNFTGGDPERDLDLILQRLGALGP